MSGSRKRTLYECSNARVRGNRITCRKGYALLKNIHDGGIDILRLARGEPLAFKVCQECPDFDSMGPRLFEGERGWLKLENANGR